MDDYGCLWMFMDDYGWLWMIMDVYGCLWMFMDDSRWLRIVVTGSSSDKPTGCGASRKTCRRHFSTHCLTQSSLRDHCAGTHGQDLIRRPRTSWRLPSSTRRLMKHPGFGDRSGGWLGKNDDWYDWLVGQGSTPSWKMMDFVNWDEYMGKSNWWQPNHQPDDELRGEFDTGV